MAMIGWSVMVSGPYAELRVERAAGQRQRRAYDEIDDGDRREDRHRVEIARIDEQAGSGQFGDADHRGDRGELDQAHILVEQRGQDAADRLRQDDVAQHLPAREPGREAGLDQRGARGAQAGAGGGRRGGGGGGGGAGGGGAGGGRAGAGRGRRRGGGGE